MEPKEDAGRESDENMDSAKKSEPLKKSKTKGKGAGLVAGLALMHGFSATNIGTKRLTVSLISKPRRLATS